MAETLVYCGDEGAIPLKMQLTSAKNPLLQSLRRAAALGKPTDDGLIVAEGPHLLEEALRSEWRVVQVFVSGEARQRYAGLLERVEGDVIEVSARALAATAATETTQEVLSTLAPSVWQWSHLVQNDLNDRQPLIVVLDGVQDPGNAGTLVRSAEAFGASGLVFLRGSVRIANAKFIRAAAGSIFRVPFLEQVTPANFIETARARGLKIFPLTANGRTNLSAVNFRLPCALVTGSESAGVSPELLAAGETVFIPTVKIESLNAATASSIALFEASRQREVHDPI